MSERGRRARGRGDPWRLNLCPAASSPTLPYRSRFHFHLAVAAFFHCNLKSAGAIFHRAKGRSSGRRETADKSRARLRLRAMFPAVSQTCEESAGNPPADVAPLDLGTHQELNASRGYADGYSARDTFLIRSGSDRHRKVRFHEEDRRQRLSPR